VESGLPTLCFGSFGLRDLHHFHEMSRGLPALVQFLSEGESI
jgi:hypothetical protein